MLSEEECQRLLKEGFSDDYFEDFGTLICFQKGPLGEYYCPACDQLCNKHVGHRECQETYVRPAVV